MNDVHDLHIDTDVTVQLSECRREDAQVVLDALAGVYRLEDRADPVPRTAAGPAATIWTATFDTADGQRRDVPPTELSAAVCATLTGGYHAVAEVEKVLAAGFDVQSRQSVSGDQETEARLLLVSRRA